MNDFGPFSKRGEYVWSSNAASEDPTWGEALARATGAGAIAAGAGYAATRTRADGTKAIDTFAYTMQQFGNETPFQIAHTLRIPEWVSPVTSAVYQGLESEGSDYVYRWGSDVLHNEGTYSYLRRMTGRTDSEMIEAGIGRSAAWSADPGMADELIFKRGSQKGLGDLFTRTSDGEEKLFAKGVRLMQLTPDAYDVANIVDKRGSVNRAFYSVLQSLDLWNDPTFYDPGTGHDQVEKVFSRLGTDGKWAGSTWAPIIAEGPVGSVDELWRRSSFARAPLAFGMERFNRLISGLSEQIGGETFASGVKRVLGTGIGTVPAPASKMFWRFGTKAAAAMGVYYGLQESDWIRRQGGVVGHAAMAAGTSAGLGWFAGKMGLGSRVQAGIAIGGFALQMVAPGFEKGVLPGMVETYANVNVAIANDLNPINHYRRTLEGYAPGITSWKTGAAIGAAALTASYLEMPWSGETLAQTLARRRGLSMGLPDAQAPRTLRQRFWANMNDYMSDRGHGVGAQDVFSFRERLTLRRQIIANMGYTGAARQSRDLWVQAEDAFNESKKLAGGNDPAWTRGMLNELDSISERYAGRTDLVSKVRRQGAGLWAQTKYGFFGVPLHERTVKEAIKTRSFATGPGRGGLILGAAIAGWGLATGGIFGSMETSDELKDIYSGKKLVEIKKGRFWEGGGTPFEGGDLSYHRPHYVALTLNRVRERGLWGNDEDSRSPLYKAYLRNFTYEWEKENYERRPYGISSPAFQDDVPIIGGFLAETIGRLIKPRKIMHPDEWLREEDGVMHSAQVYQGWRREPSYALGAETPGMPMTHGDIGQMLPTTIDQFRELEGLTGFLKNELFQAITGTDVGYSNSPLLQQSGSAHSDLRRFWENSMGGGFFMNEAIRRIFPNPGPNNRREINPVLNDMPGWIPEDLHYGDPYNRKFMEWGEARLPGAGYEALHPELEGTPTEDYPLIYQYDILSTASPYSKELRAVRKKLYLRRSKGETSQAVNEWMDEIDVRVQDRYAKWDYQHVHKNAIEAPGSEITQAFQSRLKLFMREAIAPVEYMVPMGFRPMQKLLGDDRSPIEQYEYERLYGTPFAFWDKPWRDWFRPALYSAAHNMGFSDKPGWRVDADNTNSYFDKLEFMQMMRAAEVAQMEGRHGDAFNFEFMASTTLAGTDPYSDPVSSYWSLPSQDRKFFEAFANAPEGDRNRILEMVPDNQARIYQALWDRMDQEDPSLYPGEGRPKRDYLRSRYAEMSQEMGGHLPPDEWIGWNPDVDMDDIKVRYIDTMGKDLSDYGMWESTLKKSMRQPYLAGSGDAQYHAAGINRVGQRAELMRHTGYTGAFSVHGTTSRNSYARIDYNDRRHSEIGMEIDRRVNGY